MPRFACILVLVGVVLSTTMCMADLSPAVQPHKPIPVGAGAFTQKQFDEQLKKFNSRTMMEAYQKWSTHDPKWDAAATEFLTAYQKGSTSRSDLLKQGKAVLDMGCDDPVVVTFYGALLQSSGQYEGSAEFFKQAVKSFEGSKYPKYWLFTVMDKYPNYFSNIRPNLFQETLIASYSDGSYLPSETRIALMSFPTQEGSSSGGSTMRSSMDVYYDLLENNKPADKYLYNVAKARCLIFKAWQARGGGWASEVTEEGWTSFNRYMKEAYSLLKEAWKLHPEYPEAPSHLVDVAMCGNTPENESPRFWFDKAVAAQFDYGPAYYWMTNSLLPRWGGSAGELYDFAKECAKTGRFDTNVPARFFGIMNYATNRTDGDPSYAQKPEIPQLFKTVCDGYAKTEYGGSSAKWKSLWAAYACRTGRYEDARKTLDELGEHVEKSEFSNYNVDFEDALGAVHLCTSPAAQDGRRVESLKKAGKTEEAHALYKKLAQNPTGDKAVDKYLKKEVVLLGFAASYKKHIWTALKPSDDFTAWFSSGSWTLEEDGISSKLDSDYGLLIYNERFDNWFELEADMEFSGIADNSRAGFVITPVYPEQSGYYFVFLDPKAQKLVVEDPFRKNVASASDIIIKTQNHLKVQVKNRLMTVYLNDLEVIKQSIYTWEPGAMSQVGLSVCGNNEECNVKFLNFRIKWMEPVKEDNSAK